MPDWRWHGEDASAMWSWVEYQGGLSKCLLNECTHHFCCVCMGGGACTHMDLCRKQTLKTVCVKLQTHTSCPRSWCCWVFPPLTSGHSEVELRWLIGFCVWCNRESKSAAECGEIPAKSQAARAQPLRHIHNRGMQRPVRGKTRSWELCLVDVQKPSSQVGVWDQECLCPKVQGSASEFRRHPFCIRLLVLLPYPSLWQEWPLKDKKRAQLFIYLFILIRIYLLYRGIHCDNSK
jgi:hypothetical protein